MASRSFKPASYLASAAQQTPSRSPRPSFARTSSSSSNISAKSDDSVLATFRTLNTSALPGMPGEGNTAPPARETDSSHHNPGGASSPLIIALGSPVSRPQKFEDTPSRKRSKPIAIELPPRNAPTAYTPLTGRGEKRGGYFPDHDDYSKSYKGHHLGLSGSSNPGSPSNMSASSSVLSSPSSEITPRGGPSILTSLPPPTAPILDTLNIPAGKYYPSNYQSPENSRAATPANTSAPSLPPTNLIIPPANTIKTKRQKSGHERNSSDVKRKLQQYQRDMIAQARLATSLASGRGHGMQIQMPKPISPKLVPAGSPGPITPFELEEGGSYITAAPRGRENSLSGDGLESGNQLVEDIISMEAERAVLTNSNTLN